MEAVDEIVDLGDVRVLASLLASAEEAATTPARSATETIRV